MSWTAWIRRSSSQPWEPVAHGGNIGAAHRALLRYLRQRQLVLPSADRCLTEGQYPTEPGQNRARERQ